MTARRQRYSVREAVTAFGITRDDIYEWLIAGQLPAVAYSEFSGEFVEVHLDTLKELLAARKRRVLACFLYTGNVKAAYRHSTLKPKEFLSKNQIYLRHKDLAELIGVQSTPSKTRTKKAQTKKTNGQNVASARGSHWNRIRSSIIAAANDLLSENRKQLTNQSGKLVISKLAETLNDNRYKYSALADENNVGTSYRNIYDTLREAYKSGLLK